MGILIQSKNIVSILRDKRIRFGFNTLNLSDQIFSFFKDCNYDNVKLGKLFTLKSGYAFKSEDYVSNGVPLLRIGDLEKDYDKLEMVFLPEDYIDEYKSYTLYKDDIVISLTGDGRSKADRISSKFDNRLLLNQRVGVLRAKSKIKYLDYFYFIIRYSSLFKNQFRFYSNGRTQLNISPEDLLQIKIPILGDIAIDNVIEKIKPLENEIEYLKNKIKPDTEIINEAFTTKFIWDTNIFNELRNVHLMSSTLNAFANNIDNRFSYKYHNKAGAYVSQILKSQTSKRIKDYLAEDITLGKSISPSDYDENGEQYYLSMADIKNWQFQTEDVKAVSQSYFDANPSKRITLNDIIMARSGEGTIGKVAIIDDQHVEAVYADFTMRIRLKDYNHLFAYYYFRTDFFQHLIYTHKKGLGNNTNIFPSQIQEFPMIDIPLSDQENIVNKIKTELDRQEVIKQQIETEKNKINDIIEKAIR
jgi:restriction endonuclease S subunit